jgi:hypothetical protein
MRYNRKKKLEGVNMKNTKRKKKLWIWVGGLQNVAEPEKQLGARKTYI